MTPDLEALVGRARGLADTGQRRILGIVGQPGAGKSTLAELLVQRLQELAPGSIAAVPMDGWHLPQAELAARGLVSRKGAPDTFDVHGLTALLRRLRGPGSVSAPGFDRGVDDVVPDAVAVPAATPLVLVEGNYLLLDGAWAPVRGLLDEVWYLEADDDTRRARLVRRHVLGGRDQAGAEAFVDGSDEANARLVAGTRHRADLVIRA